MTIIITMAGLGSRFRRAGYNCPKYMIEAKGKTLFDWSMDSLVDYNKNVDRYVCLLSEQRITQGNSLRSIVLRMEFMM